MDSYREFQAKTVDQAIGDACRHFQVDRDALEIDIISGGSSGIFGLGAKKATVRARKRATRISQEAAPVEETVLAAAPCATTETVFEAEFEDEEEPRQAVSLTPEEQARLEESIRKIMGELLRPICADPKLSVDVTGDPILVHIDDAENSGLIIGRDGQTITALQYLANRIVSSSWPQTARIQLDAGDYRQKQYEQLQSIAQFLSQKAKKSGRVQSTRPLSSYHRRVVHMTLQDDRGVQTRSKGDGPLKRVLILPVKRHKPSGRPHVKRNDNAHQVQQ